jgi:hypothetical protein
MKTLWNGGMEDFTKVLPESEIVKLAYNRVLKLLEDTRDTAFGQGFDCGYEEGYLRGRLEGQSFLT